MRCSAGAFVISARSSVRHVTGPRGASVSLNRTAAIVVVVVVVVSIVSIISMSGITIRIL